MDNQEFKKKSEKQWMKHFMLVYPDFPKGKLVDGESPDFLVKQSTKRNLGIEITKLYLSKHTTSYSTSQHTENLKREVIEQLKKRCLLKINIPVSAHFVFFEKSEIPPDESTRLIHETERVIISKLRHQVIDNYFHVKISESELPAHIKSITLTHSPEDNFSDWGMCDGKLTPQQFIKNIEIALQKKENKLKLYQKNRFDRYWLILVTECLKCSASVNIYNLLERWSFESGFNQVFLFDLFNRKTLILK